jgi:hypothetical protein
MAEERQHSRFGGSAAARFFACPGSVALCEKVPELSPSAEQLEGSAAHKLIELCLTSEQDPQDFVGRFVEFDGVRVEVPPEMADSVKDFVDDVRADKARGALVFIEHRFSLSAFDPECFGTCDAVTYFPDTGLLRVRDYKHGVGVYVEVRNNPQLMYYGLGAMMTLGKPVKRVELCIYQPNWYGGEAAWSWDVDPGELFEFGGELVDAITAARRPDAPLCAGDHCRTSFCKARGICPELERITLSTTGTDCIPYSGDVLVPEPPKELSADRLAMVLKMRPLIMAWLNGAYALAVSEAQHGRLPTGFKAVAKKTHRRFVNPELAARQAVRAFAGLIDEDDMYSRRIITPAAFERLLGKKTVADFLTAYVEKPKGFTLVPASDKREAIPLGVLAEFEVIGELENGEEQHAE